MTTEYQVQVTGYAPTRTTAVVTVDNLVPGRRIGRAIAGFGTWFGAALVGALIPVAHLILAPVLLVASFVVLVQRLGVSALVLSAHGICPDCAAEQDLDMPRVFRLPADVTCRNCHRRLTLTVPPNS